MTASHTAIRQIPVPGDFRFDRMKFRMAMGKYTEYTLLEDGRVVRTLRHNGRDRLLLIREQDGHLEVELPGVDDRPKNTGTRRGTRDEATELVERVKELLSLDVDLNPFYQAFREEEVIGPLVERYRGLRFVRDADLFESVIKVIVGQQLNLSFAGILLQRLVQRAGDEVEWQGVRYPVFPGPEAVARLDYEDLVRLQYSRRKAEYVIDFARKVAGGGIDLEELEKLDDETFIDRLTAERGVGRWTAECVLMFGLARPNLLPAADIGLRNAIKKNWHLPKQPGEAEVRELASRWSPWASYVTLYLWESLKD